MTMPIQVQATPNPNARKFVLPRPYFATAQNFASPQAAADQPLAARLFQLAGVYNVFWAQDFVTVNKRPEVAWEPLQTQAQTLIADYVTEWS
jgi:Scaffold protein Nfu/NifU N terminal